MKYYSKSFLLLLFLFLQFPQWTVAQSDATLRNRFLSPPEDADSWCFWYWMYGAVSREGITADLEAMKQVGLGGAYLMPIKDTEQNLMGLYGNSPHSGGKCCVSVCRKPIG